MNSIPEYGDHMPITDWLDCVKCGGFIDYDGTGNLATVDQMSDEEVRPSMVKKGWKAPDWATHVVWFNR
jgi:hypothetical protein